MGTRAWCRRTPRRGDRKEPPSARGRSIARTLRNQGMPPDEIRAVLSADDPELVHRYLELHSERMEERVAERVRTLRRIEASMTNAMFDRG